MFRGKKQSFRGNCPEPSTAPQKHIPHKSPRSPTRAARPEASGAPTNKEKYKSRPAPARRMWGVQVWPRSTMWGRGSGVAIHGQNFATPGALWYFLAREKVRLTRKTINKGKDEGTASSVFLRSFPAPQESTFPSLGKVIGPSFSAGRYSGQGLLLCGCMSCFSNPSGFSKGAWGFFTLRRGVSDGQGSAPLHLRQGHI